MNNLSPEERRAKADEIARLLENEPLMVQDLIPLLPSSFFAGILPQPKARECEHCSNPAAVCEECNEKELDDLRDDLNSSEKEAEDLEKRLHDMEEKVKNLEQATAYNPPGR